jgi:hypothetical protein
MLNRVRTPASADNANWEEANQTNKTIKQRYELDRLVINSV